MSDKKTKKCSKCGIEKELNLENFYKRWRKKKDGTRSFMAQCKVCKCKGKYKYVKKYYETDKGKITRKNGNDKYLRDHGAENRLRAKLYYYKVVKPKREARKLQQINNQ